MVAILSKWRHITVRHFTSSVDSFSCALATELWELKNGSYHSGKALGFSSIPTSFWTLSLAIIRNFPIAGRSSSGKRLRCGPQSLLIVSLAGGSLKLILSCSSQICTKPEINWRKYCSSFCRNDDKKFQYLNYLINIPLYFVWHPLYHDRTFVKCYLSFQLINRRAIINTPTQTWKTRITCSFEFINRHTYYQQTPVAYQSLTLISAWQSPMCTMINNYRN